LASVLWYLHIRTLYRQLNTEKLINEQHFIEIRKRQVDLDKKEKEFIAMTLESTGGNKKEAAGILGISRRALYNKLKRHGLL